MVTIKGKFLITTDEVEQRVDTVGVSEEDELSSFRDSKEGESSSVGDSEEDESSSVGDSEEEETDPRVRVEVEEIVKAFSTMGVGNES